MSERKVFVIALDGATFDLLGPWVREGHLPALAQLIDEGVSGDLTSTFPPLTGPAWGSFMTGKTPARHGVMEFFRRKEGTYEQTLNSRLDVDGASLWRLLSDAGRQVGVMNIPLTYPPEPVNGFLITGLLTPPEARDFTYPPELLAELEAEFGVYRHRHDEKYHKSNPHPFIQEQYDILENNTQAALYLMRTKPWDFFMVHFYASDRVQHEFWHLLDPTHPQHDPRERERLGNVALDLFKAMDAAVGRLLAELDAQGGEAPVVMVMSDHGFGPIYRYFNVNTWLLKQGYLRLKPGVATRLRHLLFKLGLNYSVLSKWVLALGLGRRAVRLGRARRETLQRKVFLSLDDIDWTRSRAYAIGNFGQIYANLKGREPQGIVEPGAEYEALLKELDGQLMALTDPKTRQQVVERVMRRDEIYDLEGSPYADRAPDLAFITKDMTTKPMGLSDFASSQVFEDVYGTMGHHRMNGILISRGAGVICKGARIENAGLQDLAPTLLYLMGLPVPTDMEGQVLDALFEPEFRETHEVTFSRPIGSDASDGSAGYTGAEEEKVMDMLRALGYVN